MSAKRSVPLALPPWARCFAGEHRGGNQRDPEAKENYTTRLVAASPTAPEHTVGLFLDSATAWASQFRTTTAKWPSSSAAAAANDVTISSMGETPFVKRVRSLRTADFNSVM